MVAVVVVGQTWARAGGASRTRTASSEHRDPSPSGDIAAPCAPQEGVWAPFKSCVRLLSGGNALAAAAVLQPPATLAARSTRSAPRPNAMGALRLLSRLVRYSAYGVTGLIGVGFAALVVFQRKILYVPSLPGAPRALYQFKPERFGLTYEELWLVAKDGVKLHAWLCASRHVGLQRGPTLLFFQENAGNISHRLHNVKAMVERLGCNVLIVSYRGCVAPGHVSLGGEHLLRLSAGEDLTSPLLHTLTTSLSLSLTPPATARVTARPQRRGCSWTRRQPWTMCCSTRSWTAQGWLCSAGHWVARWPSRWR